jgi:hypothetical protein
MDFRTEWSSWVLIVLMMIIAYVIYPWGEQESNVMYATQVVGLPLAAIAVACIPVLIYCYIVKVIPDIDYSIRLAFVYLLFLFVRYLISG